MLERCKLSTSMLPSLRHQGTCVQIPLSLAWGISVHKSQGLTLNKATINLERAFESGMAYVALRYVSPCTVFAALHAAAVTRQKPRTA